LIQAQGIVLKSSTQPYRANWDLETFSKMSYLQFLIINFHNMHLPFGLKCLSSSLKFLEWTEYPLESLPLSVQLNKLVHMKMHHSKILKIWRGNHVSILFSYVRSYIALNYNYFIKKAK
jgi:hypothetical protein